MLIYRLKFESFNCNFLQNQLALIYENSPNVNCRKTKDTAVRVYVFILIFSSYTSY